LLNYSKQPSWELGIISHEILTQARPFYNYPDEYSYPIEVNLNPYLLKNCNINENLISTIYDLLQNDMEMRTPITLGLISNFC